MDGAYLTVEQLFPPRPVRERFRQSNGKIGPVKDGHTLERYIEDGSVYLDVGHPYYCSTCHGEGIMWPAKGPRIASGSADIYYEEPGFMLLDYHDCVWATVVQNWYDSSIRLEEYTDSNGLWIGDLYGDGAPNAFPNVAQALPYGVATEVTWEYSYGYDSYNMEYDQEFSWWVTKNV